MPAIKPEYSCIQKPDLGSPSEICLENGESFSSYKHSKIISVIMFSTPVFKNLIWGGQLRSVWRIMNGEGFSKIISVIMFSAAKNDA